MVQLVVEAGMVLGWEATELNRVLIALGFTPPARMHSKQVALDLVYGTAWRRAAEVARRKLAEVVQEQ